MDRIKNISQIMEIVRSQVSGSSARAKNKTSGSTSRSSPGRIGKVSQAELKKQISDKIKAANPGKKASLKESRKIFLESVILWEFGENLINDPAFQGIIDKISTTLDENEETSRHFDKLIKQLTQ